jgi:hypothetical protein
VLPVPPEVPLPVLPEVSLPVDPCFLCDFPLCVEVEVPLEPLPVLPLPMLPVDDPLVPVADDPLLPVVDEPLVEEPDEEPLLPPVAFAGMLVLDPLRLGVPCDPAFGEGVLLPVLLDPVEPDPEPEDCANAGTARPRNEDAISERTSFMFIERSFEVSP